MRSRIFITGPSGQDGKLLIYQSLLEELDVACLCRTESEAKKLKMLFPSLKAYLGDLSNLSSIVRAIADFEPHQIFHLGAFSSVSQSFLSPKLVYETNVKGTRNLLDAIIKCNLNSTKLYNASSSEIFGNQGNLPITEDHPKLPISPYGYSKLEALNLVTKFRESGHFAVSGILFNHESPLRRNLFVTRKITKHISERISGKEISLELGNLEVIRDWGWAPDYVLGMRMMLNQNSPEDLILSTGFGHSLKEFVNMAFCEFGLEGEIENIQIDTLLFRGNEIQRSVGDASKAENLLSWRPTRDLRSVVKEMVLVDLAILEGKLEEGSWMPNFKPRSDGESK